MHSITSFGARVRTRRVMGSCARATSLASLLAISCAVGCAAPVASTDDESDDALAEEHEFEQLPDIWDDLFGAFGLDDAGVEEPEPSLGARDAGRGAGTLAPGGKQPASGKLPSVNGPCPDLRSGYVDVMGALVSLTVGSGPGPVVFYWHGTATSSSEVEIGLPGATSEVLLTGGIVASFETTSGLGDNTGNFVWYTGDFDAADQIVACGLEAGLVDPARIYTAGYSAGGLQSGAMVFARSSYLASAVVYSGGPALGGLAPGTTWFEDESNIPSVLGAHGAAGSDSLVLDFHDGTILLEQVVTEAGGFAIDCDDNGDHVVSWLVERAGVGGMAWQFLKDHPYGATPYGGSLPLGYPSHCGVVP